MLAPVMLFLLSIAALFAGLMLPSLSDLLLLALPCAAASGLLCWRAWRVRTGGRRWLLLDGSNVMHWKRGAADIGPVRDVLHVLETQGFSARVVFDANAGYKLCGRFQNDVALSKQLGLPRARVTVVPKGTPADRVILAQARDLGARVVTNDRFRDWAEAHPEIATRGHLVKGGYRAGQLWLDL